MANHLASRQGAEAEEASEGEFWTEVGEDVRALQAGVLVAIPIMPWIQALIYAALGRGNLRISEPLLAGIMSGFQLPAQVLEDVVLQLVLDWIGDAEWGASLEITKALALVDALPFSSTACTQEARLLECVQVSQSHAMYVHLIACINQQTKQLSTSMFLFSLSQGLQGQNWKGMQV